MLAGQSGAAVTRLRPGTTTDTYGDDVESWTAAERKRIPRAQLQRGPSTETEGERRLLENEALLLIIGAFDLTEDDRVEFAGLVWRVEGTPLVRRSLATGTHVSARLSRVTTS
ncbi:head closure Hc1 [Microbacterium phage phiMiGM15]